MRTPGLLRWATAAASALTLAACGSTPTREKPLKEVVPLTAPVLAPGVEANSDKLFVVVTFSGGGKRAAAFSYGVLETLRDMEVTTRSGRHIRALDTVDVITGISGGSFTALAFGLYGDKLFDVYETAFLKRDVQGELIHRALNPFNWPALGSSGWGRSEMAADMYDEILFKGATYNDLRRDGPRILVGATDLAARQADFLKNHYHRPSDTIALPIHWPSVVRLADFATEVTKAVTNECVAPSWLPGDFFGTRFGGNRAK